MNEFKYWVFNRDNVNPAYSHLFDLLFSFVRRDREKTDDIWSQEQNNEEQKLLVAGQSGRSIYQVESQPPIKYTLVSNYNLNSRYTRLLKDCPRLKIKIVLNSMIGMQIIFDDGILQPVKRCKIEKQFTEQREGEQ